MTWISSEKLLWMDHLSPPRASFDPPFSLLSLFIITHLSPWPLLAILSDECHQHNLRGHVVKTTGAFRNKGPLLASCPAWVFMKVKGKRGEAASSHVAVKTSVFMKTGALWFNQHILRHIFVSRGVDIKPNMLAWFMQCFANIFVCLMFDLIYFFWLNFLN